MAQWQRICLPILEMQETGSVPGWGRHSGEEMATHPSILAWEIPQRAEPGGLESMGSKRVRQD